MLYKWSSNLPINSYSETIPLASESNWLHSVFNCFRYMNNYRLAGTHHCNGVVLGGDFLVAWSISLSASITALYKTGQYLYMKPACVWLYTLCLCDSRCLWIIIYSNNVVTAGNGGWYFFLFQWYLEKCVYWGTSSDKHAGTLNQFVLL